MENTQTKSSTQMQKEGYGCEAEMMQHLENAEEALTSANATIREWTGTWLSREFYAARKGDKSARADARNAYGKVAALRRRTHTVLVKTKKLREKLVEVAEQCS